MRIKSLTIHSFGSILNQEIHFNGEYLTTIEAINHDTGGASGAGKSMLFKAIEYGLCVLSSSAKQFENRQTGSKPHVVLVLDIDGEEYEIERRLKTSNELKITKSGTVLTHGGKEAESYLFDKVLKVPKEFFARILHKKQGEKSFFVNLTPKQSFTLLSEILGLDTYENLMDNLRGKESDLSLLIDKETNTVEEEKRYTEELKHNIDKNLILLGQKHKEKDILKEEVSRLSSQIEELSLKRDNLGEKIKEQARSSVPEELTTQIQRLGNTIASLEQEFLEKEAEKEKKLSELSDLSKKIHSISMSISKELSSLESKKESLAVLNRNKIERAKKDVAALHSDLLHLQESKCPVCLRAWSGDDFEQKIQNIKSLIQEKEQEIKNIDEDTRNGLLLIEQQILDVKKQEAQLEQLKQQELVAKTDLDLLSNRLAELKKPIQDKKDEMDALKQKALSIAKQNISDLSGQVSALNADIKTLESGKSEKFQALQKILQEVAYLEAVLNQDKERLVRAEKELIEAQKRLEDYTKEKILVSKLYQHIKSYTSMLFQDFLDGLFAEANNIIGKIPNASHIAIGYDVSKEMKNGRIKEGELSIIYSSGEYQGVSFESFSGGEQTSIGLALDIAFVKTLSSMMPQSGLPSLWILDEPFDGLDPISKMAFLDVIRESGREAIVVDHDKTVKDMSENVLLVEKKSGVSEIKWLT